MSFRTILDAVFEPADFINFPAIARAGIGLKPEHTSTIVETAPDIGFFEVHAENYMGAGGLMHQQLAAIRHKYPLSLHGVGMSIGGEAPIDVDHLARFRALVDHYKPVLVSEHLAWSTHDDIFFNDLLPLPYTQATLERTIGHVKQMQDALGRQILIENPSTYVLFNESTFSEVDFMFELANKSGCGLLFDVNNVFVSATNHQYSPSTYVDKYPLELVQEIHLAGHAEDSDDLGNALLIDSHDRKIADRVWDLYRQTLAITGPLPSLIEWDSDIPDWPVLLKEAELANAIISDSTTRKPAPQQVGAYA